MLDTTKGTVTLADCNDARNELPLVSMTKSIAECGVKDSSCELLLDKQDPVREEPFQMYDL